MSGPVSPFDLVVFGASGDLAMRKLLPALYYRDRDGQLPGQGRIIGASRRVWSRGEFLARVANALHSYLPAADLEPAALQRFCERLHYLPIDAGAEYGALAQLLEGHHDVDRVLYLATSPDHYGSICHKAKGAGLVTDRARVVLEKPIGHDLASANAILREVGGVFDEHQIYRIDHYLGKETVQNLLVLRFGNTLFESMWSNEHIDHVQITVAESIGVEKRGVYYDRAGALRDMVQNHLLQLLCIVAMEPPRSLEPNATRDEKVKVLSALKPLSGQGALDLSVRGQYRAGWIAGKAVRGYLDEPDVSSGSPTETFVALRAEIANWRWAGVPFYLRTGKRLPKRVSEIVVHFKAVPHSIFDPSSGVLAPNQLNVRLQPDEGIRLRMMAKNPGSGMSLRPVCLNLSFADTFKARQPDAYERLLMDVLRGRPTLFMRRDELEAAWRWVEPIQEAWQRSAEPPKAYAAGTWGPPSALALIGRHRHAWYEESVL
jgi:glucose-6-phosphate 1-dehydrogenase